MEEIEDMEDSVFKKGRKRVKKDKDLKWESVIERNLSSLSKSGHDRMFASSSGLCSRQTAGLMLMREEVAVPMKASTQFYFKIGSSFEEVMKRAFKKAGIYIDDELRVESLHKDVPVSGRIDFILRDPIDEDEIVLCELKSCGTKLPAYPKPAHLAQLMVYLLLTGMPKGIIWYVSRTVAGFDGVLKQVVFEVEPTGAEFFETAKTLAVGAVFAKNKILPDIPIGMKRYKCGFCSLIPYCWSGYPATFDLAEVDDEAATRFVLIGQATIIAGELMDNMPQLRKSFLEFLDKYEF